MQSALQSFLAARFEIATHCKILLGFLQTMNAFRRFDYVRWPAAFSSFLAWLNVPLDLSLLPVDCVAGCNHDPKRLEPTI